MSKTFKSAVSHREVRIWPTDAGFAIAVLDDVSNESTSTQLAPTDAPAIMLAIAEAVGINPRPHDTYSSTEREKVIENALWEIGVTIKDAAREAKEAADREALEKRRDDLAREFGSSNLGYKDTFDSTQRAIDRIIELEDKAKS